MDESTAKKPAATGSCLCGAVRFEIHGPIRKTVTACHCRICRRFSGGLFAGTMIPADSLVFARIDGLKWYRSSERGERGFCGECGASLFGRSTEFPFIALAAGSLDEPTGLVLATHSWLCEDADFWRFGPEVVLKDGPSELGFPEDDAQRD